MKKIRTYKVNLYKLTYQQHAKNAVRFANDTLDMLKEEEEKCRKQLEFLENKIIVLFAAIPDDATEADVQNARCKIQATKKEIKDTEEKINDLKYKSEIFSLFVELSERNQGKKPKEPSAFSFCPHCEHGVFYADEFCEHCGQRIDWEGTNAEKRYEEGIHTHNFENDSDEYIRYLRNSQKFTIV